MYGVEIDMIISDSLKALAVYESIFEVERIEVGNFVIGKNEVVINVYGTRFHMLDANPEYQMIAPKNGDYMPIWFNIVVPDINEVYQKALAAGCIEVQPLNEMPEMGIINAMFKDPFGYTWMLHQIVKEVSYEERCRIFEEQGFERNQE